MLIRIVAITVLTFASLAHAEPQVKPLAITVGSPALEGMDFGLRPGNVNPGVSVHVLLTGLDMPMVDIDDDASTLDQATDSTGRDLLAEPKRDGGMVVSFGGDAGVGPFPSVSDDGKAAVVELRAPQSPAKGATSMTFEGTLAVIVAAGTKVESVAGLALKPGRFQLGGHDFEITAIDKHDWEESKFKLAVRTDRAARDQIASWRITGLNGATLSEGPYSTMTMMDTVDLEFTLEEKPASATVEVTFYEGMRQVEVPVRFEVGLGIE